MLSSSPRDNWERLVAAVVKRDQIWQLCHQDSITTVSTNSYSNSHRPSNYSGQINVSISNNSSKRISVSPPLTTASASTSEVRKNASGPITRKLFSALQRRIKPKNDVLDHTLEDLQLPMGQVKRFSLHELQFATENFHDKNIIGRGAESKIYKGRLPDGSLMAVKRLTKEMGKELEITSTAAHRNVLRAHGFCITEKDRLLVFPFMVNNSVASQLRERDESLPPLDWPVRKRIAIGAAKGLAYLHHECHRKIIHRDVKAANILLDDDFEAVVADFNLAEFMDCYDSDVVSTPIKGTMGHIAPEYLATGKYSVKTDVFGYGIFLLELITAQRGYDVARLANDNDVMLLNTVKRSYKEMKWKTMVDAELQINFVEEEVLKLLKIALICTETDPKGRPTMLEVVMMLEVGHGLAERWEEWCENDFNVENFEIGHLRRFTIHELQAATEDFSNKIISEDGFNLIYQGWLDGSPVAVKRYNSSSLEDQFEKELDIGRICLHPNVVHVLGFCQTRDERLIVFRLMVNGSVESWLRGRHESRPPLTWQKRKEIALGAARGLAYLHDKCGKKIIHRNVKASNILLDENFEVAVADFGMAKFMNWNDTYGGTIGHIAPEYLATGECSEKTDVYAYGVFLLELVSGQKASDLLRLATDEGMMLIDWVKRNYQERKWEVMVDEDNGDDEMEDIVCHLVPIALLCALFPPHERPKMSSLLWMLGDDDGWNVDSSEDDAEELSGPR